MDAGILTAFFARRHDAWRALRKIDTKDFQRLLLIHKSETGQISVENRLLGSRLWRALQFCVLFLLLLGVPFAVLDSFGIISPSPLLFYGLMLMFAGSGALVGWGRFCRRTSGERTDICSSYARSLLPGESLLLIEAPVDVMARSIEIVREQADQLPSIFVQHPSLEKREVGREAWVALSRDQISERALFQAIDHHQLPRQQQKKTELLKRLKGSRGWIHEICCDLAEACRLEQGTSPVAEWIIDNEFVVAETVRDVLQNLPPRYFRELPTISSDPYLEGLPLVYGLAKELVADTELRLNRENILSFLTSYQSVRVLSTAELWAVPQMLRIALVESIQSIAISAHSDLRRRQLAALWANRLIAAERQFPEQIPTLLNDLSASDPSVYFCTQLIDHLYDEEALLIHVERWIEQILEQPLNVCTVREQNRQTKAQISISNAFTSLRHLTQFDWRDIFEQVNRIEQVLRFDPAGVYARMDFVTRDRYRSVVETLARRTGQPEEDVAHSAVELANQAVEAGCVDERAEHIGTYLIGDSQCELADRVQCQEPLCCRARRWAEHHHGGLYLVSIGLLTLFFLGSLFWLGRVGLHTGPLTLLLLTLLGAIPASQMAIQVTNFCVTRLLSPQILPKMDFEETGIPDEFRTLVVVPTLLVDPQMLQKEIEKLEIRYMANREDNLVFGLLTDFTDAATQSVPEDGPLLLSAVAAIERLNQRHGAGRFLLFHRERVWSDSEHAFIGRERKRGKLEELNRLLIDPTAEEHRRLIHAGDPAAIAGVRFVITLDSDTQLPHGTARRMIETLAHPLNRPRLDNEGGVLPGGYTIIQPRVSPSLATTGESSYSRFFADAVGVDPYTKVVSDVYQDLSGQGSYHGKGIYDVQLFSSVLDGHFPEERILSHDLIEGEYVRVGLATDIELYDEFPTSYQGDSGRLHRWMRGDWQIAQWLFPTVPSSGGRRVANRLSLFSRWKIFDNLRRSLLPVTSVGFLLTTWCVDPRLGLVASLAIGTQVFFHPLAQLHAIVTSRAGLKSFSPERMGHNLLRAAVDAALMPHQAIMSVDAIVRAWYRCHISHRYLLQWKSAQLNTSGSAIFAIYLFAVSPLGLLAMVLVYGVSAFSLPAALPYFMLWIFSPLIVWLLSRQPLPRETITPLVEKDQRYLRTVARRTWRYFSDFVDDRTHWLPPDNYQVSHQDQLAMRTSPTNIGLWMLSLQAARDAGYVSADRVVDRLTRTLDTIDRLERYEGHLLNWYDIETLQPLEPRYVSSVDSGNLLGSLWTLEHGLVELLTRPLVDDTLLSGLWETVRIFLDDEKAALDNDTVASFKQLLARCDSPCNDGAQRLSLFADCCQLLQQQEDQTDEGWSGQLKEQVADWRMSLDRYLGWYKHLTAPAENVAGWDDEVLAQLEWSRCSELSLQQLQDENLPILKQLHELKKQPRLSSAQQEVIDMVLAELGAAQRAARETMSQVQVLIDRVHALAAAINMGFLYSDERKLFAIGYNVSANRLDNAFYDLLASESRFGSFVAIARGEVPMEHWFSLGRPYGKIGYRRALLSWTGTMFEYLMPVIFQRSYDNSLLDRAIRQAVGEQINYARRHRIPWGMSESAYGDLDLNKTYQYKAFGVPTLGLKRVLKNKHVVAPYASLLAVSIAPGLVVQNLRRLDQLGMLKTYGFYESIDFSRRDDPGGERAVVIKAYMAHHQGMGFLALVNFLHDEPLLRRFHADSRVRAFELLLQERVPTLPPLHLISTRESVTKIAAVGELSPTAYTFESPDTPIPKSQFLSNGRYDLMITNSGSGYSQWGGSELTRWRVDRICEQGGIYCYIHDQDADTLWSNTYLPVTTGGDNYRVEFPLDRAVFQREEHGIQTETVVVVSPEDDVEIRRLTLVNRSSRRRRLRLTSYVELSMAPHRADLQHPAFNKMFIETEAIPDSNSLLAHRRPRSDDAQPLYLAHRLTCDQGDDLPFNYETDRRTFIGRGQTLADPQGSRATLEDSQGFVLDPVLSLRRDVILEPHQHLRLSLIVATGEKRDQVLQLMTKYGEDYAIERALDFVWRASQIELRMLHIQPHEARRFRQLADHLLFPNTLLRAPAAILAENNRGQSALWPYGISGDLPIILTSIGKVRDIGLVRQLLQAQAYWLRHGLIVDLVILNEESGSYDEPLRERLLNLIQAHAMFIGRERAGGVFLRSVDQLPEEDIRLFKSVASVVLVAARGTLAQQLGATRTLPELPERLETGGDSDSADIELPLADLELVLENGVGGFSTDGREYVVTLEPGVHTPAPWVNVMANPDFGALVSESGAGFCWFGNSQRNRLTGWSNDPVLDPATDVIYLRDEENGQFWTPTAAPLRSDDTYRVRHGIGYSLFEHNSHGIEQTLTRFVPNDTRGGDPLCVQLVSLTNRTNRRRSLSLTSYAELVLGENRETSQMHVLTRWDEDVDALLAWNRYHPDYADRVTFVATSHPVRSHCGDRSCFVGRHRTLSDPLAMHLSRLACQSGAGLDPCAALQVEVVLQPQHQQTVAVFIGQADSIAQARALIRKYQKVDVCQSALEETRDWWAQQLGGIEVKTPDPAADLLINRWLLYQSLSCRIWGRSAVYQSGGAFGYRDQLQDVMAFLYTTPDVAREQIRLAASRQFREGDVQHWWHPPTGAGIRSRISDDLLWLPFVVAQYVRVTGDDSLLREEASFLNAPELAADQHEVFAVPDVALDAGTIYEHCRRAVAKGLTRGAMGLPLIGTGDWNDGMNLVGAQGRGESVWLAWFLVDVLQGMIELAEQVNDEETRAEYRRERQRIIAAIEENGWDGGWYLRGTFDDGSLLGSSRCVEAKIDSLPQSWAWLSGAADSQRAGQALDAAWAALVREDEKIVQLFDPPFNRSTPSPGYIKGYPPGVRENGGQYTHAALWFAMALARRGDGERAVDLLTMLNPLNHTRDQQGVWRYGVEPYAVAADVYRLPGRVGQGGWSWYTGSAAWMYRAWIEEVLGLKIRGKQMWLDPVIPADWPGFSIRYKRDGSVYQIDVDNPHRVGRGVSSVEVDGVLQPDAVVPLKRGAGVCRVIVQMGS